MKKRMIQYDDDLVIVYDKNGKVIYKGLEDYEPYKRELWRWDDKKGYYTFNGMIKKCVG